MKIYGVVRAQHRPTFNQTRTSEAAVDLAKADERSYPTIGPHIPIELEIPDSWLVRPAPSVASAVRRLDQ